MATWFVHRREDGTIASAHEERQPGYAEEAVDDSANADLVAFTQPVAARVISATDFLNRLGADGPALMATPFAFALVRLAAAGTIDLADAQVVAGFQSVVDAGVLTKARADELLKPRAPEPPVIPPPVVTGPPVVAEPPVAEPPPIVEPPAAPPVTPTPPLTRAIPPHGAPPVAEAPATPISAP